MAGRGARVRCGAGAGAPGAGGAAGAAGAAGSESALRRRSLPGTVAAGPTGRPPRQGRSTTEGFYSPVAGDLVLQDLPSEAALEGIVLRRLRLRGAAAIYAHAVDPEGPAAAAGLKAGMAMRALRDPHKEELYPVSGTERLEFIRTNWEVTDNITMVFEGEPSITAELVEEAQRAEQAAAAAPPRPPKLAKERPDLYSDTWEGDRYIGGSWNILTVSSGLLLLIVTVGILVGVMNYGDTSGAF